MTIAFPRLRPHMMTGKERLRNAGDAQNASVLDFWRWQGSNLLDNTQRGVLAEFLVALALGRTGTPRVEWDECDCRTENGIRVEVKSSAYIQSWDQKAVSKIHFDIAPKQILDKESNAYGGAPERPSDVYVFCVFSHKDQKTADPLDMSQWEFHVVPTKALDAGAPTQKTITLSSLLARFTPDNPPYARLREAVLAAARI